MLNGTSLPLFRVATLLPGVGQILVASALVTCWVALLCNPSMVYLKMSFGAWKVGVSYMSCMSLPDATFPAPCGHGTTSFGCCAHHSAGCTPI
jgi:hypothetical protein